MADLSPITVARFWSKVSIPSNTADCWEWSSTQNDKGYGRTNIDERWVLAHRFSYEFAVGPIPDGLIVRHLCHNRLCCNPAHLAVGTSKDNAQDALAAGRFSSGKVNGNSKLDEASVIYIRQNPDKLKGRELARKFGISPATVSGVKNCRVWRDV